MLTVLLFPQSPVPTDPSALSGWLWSQQGILELCHNWGTESDPSFKHCSGNEKEHKGFGQSAHTTSTKHSPIHATRPAAAQYSNTH